MGIDLRDVDQPIGTLSGGERQCVAIARAVYFGAKVLVLDEPTAALGVKQSGVVLKYVAAARDAGLGVVLITHNPHHAYLVGDRFVLLKRGAMSGSHTKDGDHPGRADPPDGGRQRAGRAQPRAASASPARRAHLRRPSGHAATPRRGARTARCATTDRTRPRRSGSSQDERSRGRRRRRELPPAPRQTRRGTMSTYRDLAHRGSARATVLRTVGTRERRSHLTAPRVPTVGIDIGGTKVMAGVVDADGNILEKLRTETPDKSKSPKVVEDTIVELVLDLSDRHDVHAVGIGAAGWVDADRSAGAVRPAPVLARRAAARPPRRPPRRPRHGRQRRQHRRLGGVALRRRPRRGPPRHDHARHRHRRRDPGGRPGQARQVRRRRRVRPHAGRARRPPLPVRQPRLLGAVQLRQRPGPRGPRAGRRRLPGRVRDHRAGQAATSATSPGR